jgi:glycosyltransferase involved in cell wall biosynthesis
VIFRERSSIAFDKGQEPMIEPLVSVIVPTRNSEKTIGPCLESIAGQSYSHIEIIVVDNHSDDLTCRIAARYTDKVFQHGPERSAQRNYGAQVSSGEYLLFPDSDMELTPEVVKECVEKVISDEKVKAIVIPEESFGVGFWANCRRLERSFYIGVEWLEAARFFKKTVFEEMGGYDLRNTGTEDFDLPQRIKGSYGPGSNSRITALVYHNEQEMGLIEAIKTNYYYGHNLDAYLSVRANRQYFRKQYNIIRRYALFFSDPKRLFRNPILGLGTLFMKACDAGAWATGFLVSRVRESVGLKDGD